MMKKKVILTCGVVMLTKKCLNLLRRMFRLVEIGCTVGEDSLLDSCEGAAGIIMGGFEIVTERVVKRLLENAGHPGKVMLIFLGIQYDTFFTPDALDFCRENGITIYFTGEGSQAVAKRTVKTITCWNPTECQIITAQNSPQVPPEHEIVKAQNILIVGAGKIGTLVAEMLKGKARELRYWARNEKQHMQETGARYYSDLEKAFNGADVATLHLALNVETKGLVRYCHLKGLNPGGLLINAARNELVLYDSLVQAFDERLDIRNLWDTNIKELSSTGLRQISALVKMINSSYLNLTGHTFAITKATASERSRRLITLISENNLIA